MFTMPWSATITYGRPLVLESRETICAENIQYYPGKDAEAPRAARPDF